VQSLKPVFKVIASATARFLLFFSFIFVIAGCASHKKHPYEYFVAQYHSQIKDEIMDANIKRIAGVASLSFRIDHTNAVTDCDAVVEPDTVEAIALARLVENSCWSLVLPRQVLFEQDGKEILHKLRIEAPDEYYAMHPGSLPLHAQQRFLWRNIFEKESIAGIGIARFSIDVDHLGKAQRCNVSLDPHPNRPEDFRKDRTFQLALRDNCLATDFSEHPGFKIKNSGLQTFRSVIRYSPWRINTSY
jgi:hypothetical protein